jgi:hypothetical protein
MSEGNSRKPTEEDAEQPCSGSDDQITVDTPKKRQKKGKKNRKEVNEDDVMEIVTETIVAGSDEILTVKAAAKSQLKAQASDSAVKVLIYKMKMMKWLLLEARERRILIEVKAAIRRKLKIRDENPGQGNDDDQNENDDRMDDGEEGHEGTWAAKQSALNVTTPKKRLASSAVGKKASPPIGKKPRQAEPEVAASLSRVFAGQSTTSTTKVVHNSAKPPPTMTTF